VKNLKALQQLLPQQGNTVAVLEFVPVLLLSNMQKIVFLKISLASYKLHVAIVEQVLC